MGDLFLTIYICTYVRGTYVRTGIIMLRSGMLIGMLRVSCRPIELYLLRGLDGARTTTLRNRSVDERAVLQGLQSWSSYIWSQTVTYGVKQSTSRHLSIPQLHNNPEGRVQASGAFRACRSRAATCGVEQ